METHTKIEINQEDIDYLQSLLSKEKKSIKKKISRCKADSIRLKALEDLSNKITYLDIELVKMKKLVK